jgi:tetratricopeptide (TPR) repeat protein
MQKRRTDDIVHAVMTDHWIQRSPQFEKPLAELPERHGATAEYAGEIVPYYPSPLPQTDANNLYSAIARSAPAELARELAHVDPREPAFYLELGNAWQKTGKLTVATAAYQQALVRSPNFPRALRALTTAWQASGQLIRADELLKRAIRIAPENAVFWFQSGTADFSLGRNAMAIEYMQKAITLDQDLTGEHTGLAEVLWRTGKIELAASELQAALRVDPYDASACDLAGRILASESKTEESLFDFEKATRLRPGYAPYLYDYALELSTADKQDEARTTVSAALQVGPNMPEAHELLGGIIG